MFAGDKVLFQLCHFMTDANSGPWFPKDLRTIASLQATCKATRSIRNGFIEERKSVAIRDGFIEDRKSVDKAHKATMRQLKKHIDEYIYEAIETASEYHREEYFINPFTGEFDYTDYRGAWNDDDRVKYNQPLTVEEIEERDRMMRGQLLPLNLSRLVHHGLKDNFWRRLQEASRRRSLEETDFEYEYESSDVEM
jgi:hypothetical protein